MSTAALAGFNLRQQAEQNAKEARDSIKSGKKTIEALDRVQNIDNFVAEELRKVPSEAEAQERLKTVKEQLQAERSQAKKDRAKLANLEALEREFTTLAGDFSKKNELLDTLRQQIIDRGDKIEQIESDMRAAAARAERLENEVKEFDKILNKDQFKTWQKDRTADAPRKIEEDLKKMRAALEKYPNKPVDSTQACAYNTLKQHLEKVEKELDQVAHKAPCHKCKALNGIERSEAAKKLVQDKIKKLEELAKRPDKEGLSSEDYPDYLLAKALDSMSKTEDENGKTAGKMIGALICKDADDKIVILYGYSGEIASTWREANAAVVRAEKFANGLSEGTESRALADKALESAKEWRDKAGELDKIREEIAEEEWCKPIPQTGAQAVLKSAGGATETLATLNHGNKKTPHGVCAAPKMIQEAYKKGLKPVGMAEAWYGGGDNTHGDFVASCETCVKNIGFQLCPACK